MESIGVGQECQGEPNLGVWSLNWGDMETLLAPPIVNTYVPGGRGCKSMSIACSITTSNSALSQAGWHPLILIGTRAMVSNLPLLIYSISSYIAKNQSSDLIFRPQLLFPPVKSSSVPTQGAHWSGKSEQRRHALIWWSILCSQGVGLHLVDILWGLLLWEFLLHSGGVVELCQRLPEDPCYDIEMSWSVVLDKISAT